MANKLRNVFNKNNRFIKGTIRFEDETASKKFGEAIDLVLKEGQSVQVDGIESIAYKIDSGVGSFPMEKFDNIKDMVIGLTPEEISLKLDIEGKKIDFPVNYFRFQNGRRIQTKNSFAFDTELEFDENTVTAEVRIKPCLDRAENVNEVLWSIKTVTALLKLFFNMNPNKEVGLVGALDYLEGIYQIFEKLEYVERVFGNNFVPGLIDLDNIEDIMDLIEVCLLIRDKKTARGNFKMKDSIGKKFEVANDEIFVGRAIAMSFIRKLDYSLWGEKIELYTANFLNNAYIRGIEELEDGQVRVIYGENEGDPMYVSYKGFVSEDEAIEESKSIMSNMDEYKNAKTVEQYIEEEMMSPPT